MDSGAPSRMPVTHRCSTSLLGPSKLSGMGQIPPGVNKVTDDSDELIYAKVLMADNSLATFR